MPEDSFAGTVLLAHLRHIRIDPGSRMSGKTRQAVAVGPPVVLGRSRLSQTVNGFTEGVSAKLFPRLHLPEHRPILAQPEDKTPRLYPSVGLLAATVRMLAA